jgi:hypothetical protein
MCATLVTHTRQGDSTCTRLHARFVVAAHLTHAKSIEEYDNAFTLSSLLARAARARGGRGLLE